MARILVVDDENSIRVSLREFLRDADYEVDTAEDADEAIGMLVAEAFDVVVTDIILPRITGVGLLKSIKEASPHTQVILMTGEPTVGTASEAVRLGAFDYLAKPVGKEQFLRTVANAAKVKALDDEHRRLAEENQVYQEDLERLVDERTAALRLSEERMGLTLRGADLGTWDWNVQTGDTTFNERFATMLGYTVDELEPHVDEWKARVHPDDRPAVENALNAHLKGETDFYATEHRVKHRSGEWIWVLDTGQVIERGDGGEALRACGIHLDITERKIAAAVLGARLRQQTALTELGERALAGPEPLEIMDLAAIMVAKTLEVEYCKVLELLPGAEKMLLLSGTGWHDGLVGVATVDTGDDSQAGHTIREDNPVVVDDLRTEQRFAGPGLLREHDVVSGMSVIIQGARQPFGVLGAHTKQHRVFDEHDVNFLQAVATVIGVSVARHRAEDEVARSARRLRHLAARLQEIREEERTAIARELHDELGQALTGVNMDLAWITGRLEGADPALQERVRAAVELVGDTIGTVRRMSSELRPPELDELGVFDAIAGYVDTFAQRTGLEVGVEWSDSLPDLADDAATAVFRIVQESLTNVARHADAHEVQVQVEAIDGTLVVRIIDDGQGIPPEKTSGELSLGLLGMRERAASFGGRLKIGRHPAGGTEVALTLPLGATGKSEPE